MNSKSMLVGEPDVQARTPPVQSASCMSSHVLAPDVEKPTEWLDAGGSSLGVV